MAVLITVLVIALLLVVRYADEREQVQDVVTFEKWAAAYDAGSADEDALYTAYAMSTADRRGAA